MAADALRLVKVAPWPDGEYWRAFAPSDKFPAPWWESERRVDSIEHWLSVRRHEVEVVRCKYTLEHGPLTHESLGSMPHGQLDAGLWPPSSRLVANREAHSERSAELS